MGKVKAVPEKTASGATTLLCAVLVIGGILGGTYAGDHGGIGPAVTGITSGATHAAGK